jgi:lanosterol synthase
VVREPATPLNVRRLSPRRLLPEWLPFHPWRWWIHTRNVYIPMSYLYTVRYQAPVDDLITSLREV